MRRQRVLDREVVQSELLLHLAKQRLVGLVEPDPHEASGLGTLEDVADVVERHFADPTSVGYATLAMMLPGTGAVEVIRLIVVRPGATSYMRHAEIAPFAVLAVSRFAGSGASSHGLSRRRSRRRRSMDTRSCAATHTIPRRITQGLEFFDGFLYEGTGMKGSSAVRKVELETGKVVQEDKLHPQYFGEGITIAQGKVFQLTWQDRSGFVYDAKTLKFIRNFSYFGEGWGLTHDPRGLIMSDGTSTLRFLETTRFQERRRLKVIDAGVADRAAERARDGFAARSGRTSGRPTTSPGFRPKEGRVLGWINLKGLLGAPTAKLSAMPCSTASRSTRRQIGSS